MKIEPRAGWLKGLHDLWDQHIEPPSDAGDVRAVRTYVISLVAATGLIATAAYTGLTVSQWQFADPSASWYGPNMIARTAFTLAACILSYTLARRGRPSLATLPLLAVLALQIIAVSLVNPLNPAVSMWIFSVAVSATILLGGEWGFSALLLALAWHGIVMQSRSQLSLALVRDEAITGLITWVLVWVSTLRVNQALTRHLDQVQRANRQVAQERDKLSTILAKINDAVLAIDQDRRVLLVNDAARRTLGLGALPAIARPWTDVIPAGPLHAFLARAIDADAPLAEEVAWEDRVLDVSITPAEGVGWVAVLHDVTYLKELDKVRTEFVATASHDLKNPINVVKMAVDLLLMMGAEDEKQVQLLRRIDRAAALMVNLVEDLLEIARIESGLQLRIAPLDTGALIDEALDDVRPSASAKGHTLTRDAPDALPPIQGDPDHLRRVLTNLLSNAIKYTHPNGRIRLSVAPNDGFMRFEIADNGIGIAEEDLPHIFERFFRASLPEVAEVEGTGLGLSIVKAIVEQHGGAIWVESTPGEGSTFGFTVPLVTEATPVTF
ncbi:MAG: hypothetical protein Kow00120_21180 [Anaerolineae bacterium]